MADIERPRTEIGLVSLPLVKVRTRVFMRIFDVFSASWLPVRAWSAVIPVALLATAASIGTAMLVQDAGNIYSLDNLFLLAVLISALLGGIRGGLIAALCSFLSYNYFFIPPKFTLSVANPEDFFELFMFFLTALVTGGLAGRIREHYHEAERHSQAMQSLAALSGRLSAATHEEQILAAISEDLANRWAVPHAIVAHEPSGRRLVLSYPQGWGLKHGPFEGEQSLIWSLTPTHGPALSVVVQHDWPLGRDREVRQWLDAIFAQAVIALERTALARENEIARAQAEREQLRASLLSSVSHDLRTPLASIIGSASTLRQFDATLDPEIKRELAETIEDEAVRLARFVDHLLAVTRTESEIAGQAEAFDLADILYPTVERARRYFDRHTIRLSMQDNLPLLMGFPALVEQGIFNLLENAAKYSPPASTITVDLGREADRLVVSVSDEGMGIPVEDQAQIFDKFVRLKPHERQMGAGLGLTITRNIAQLMQATVSVQSPLADGRGSCFRLSFPIPEPLPEPVAS